MRVLVFILVLLWLQKHSVKKCYHKNCGLLTTVNFLCILVLLKQLVYNTKYEKA